MYLLFSWIVGTLLHFQTKSMSQQRNDSVEQCTVALDNECRQRFALMQEQLSRDPVLGTLSGHALGTLVHCVLLTADYSVMKAIVLKYAPEEDRVAILDRTIDGTPSRGQIWINVLQPNELGAEAAVNEAAHYLAANWLGLALYTLPLLPKWYECLECAGKIRAELMPSLVDEVGTIIAREDAEAHVVTVNLAVIDALNTLVPQHPKLDAMNNLVLATTMFAAKTHNLLENMECVERVTAVASEASQDPNALTQLSRYRQSLQAQRQIADLILTMVSASRSPNGTTVMGEEGPLAEEEK